jgi:2-polyprenyl-6-methoxyphenol hydroxylase-like FAD-dependent oxidoreductase
LSGQPDGATNVKQTEVPILIIGGGAAGTVLSVELARQGVEFRLVDRLSGPPVTSRAIAVHARTLEMIDRIDRNLTLTLLERGIHNKGYVLHFVDADGRRSEVRPGIDFTRIDCEYPFILVHGQSDTENLLRDYMKENYGRAIEWGAQCVDVKRQEGAVTATLQHTSGRTEVVNCEYLVACDGINSTVRSTLSVSQKESDYPGTVLQNMDVFLNGFPDVDDYIHYCAGTDHFIMIVRLPGGFYRLLLSDRGESAGPNVTPEEGFMRLVDRHFDGVSLGDLVWHSKWESWVRLADTYREGNVLLAGDSAHVHSTTGGQGMNCCMQDAANLGWKLGLVQRGLADPALLDTYEAERKPIAEQVIWAASALHDIFMGHGKDITERAAKISDPEFLEAVVGRCSGISYTYRDYVAQPDGVRGFEGAMVGDRAADVRLGPGRSLYDLIRHTEFTLVAFTASSGQRELKKVVNAVEHRFDGAVVGHLERLTEEISRRYGYSDDGVLLLIRPDGYIAHRCVGAEAPSVDACLSRILRR